MAQLVNQNVNLVERRIYTGFKNSEIAVLRNHFAILYKFLIFCLFLRPFIIRLDTLFTLVNFSKKEPSWGQA